MRPASGSADERPVSRRRILGLGAVAGASASALVAGGIVALGDNSTTTVDAHGAEVITAQRQDLSVEQQQQAATNIGVVRTVEPEQFPGSTDDEQIRAAVHALGVAGGVIRLRPGKAYTWTSAIPAIDFSAQGGLVLTAWGASVTYTGTGAALTSLQTRTVAGTRTLTVLGGEWIAPKADAFFAIVDSGNNLFYRARGEVPGGTFFHLSNKQFWSERNHFIEIEDHNCREVVRFTVDGSQHESFARTLVKDLRLQGGVAGYPKINIIAPADASVVPAPYDSIFDGIVGNIADGVIVQRLAGGLSGTTIGRIQVESPQASTTAAVWQVGNLVGHPPLLPDGPPVLRNLVLFTPDSTSTAPFAPNEALGGLSAGAAVTTAPVVITVATPGAVSVDADVCNAAVVVLNAPCTASTIATTLAVNRTQSLTLAFEQGATGGYAYAWPTNCRFAGGIAPAGAAPNTRSSVTFAYREGFWLETARAEGVPIA